ncbi:MAG: hypothetical protein IH947_03610 [Bacteroidetes bacterium]|nr:hypothetical protein [Bacteroidota bacterium]MCH8233793.1 hypothetical protein [Bacteroidota bacterium]
MDEVGSRIKINIELRNKLLNEGNAFARSYITKSRRRNESFLFDTDKLKAVLNNPDLVKLKVDPTWENTKEITNRQLMRAFNEFMPYQVD